MLNLPVDNTALLDVHSRARVVRGASSLVLAALLVCANAAFAQDRYDQEVNIALDRLLPESLIASGEHRVVAARRAGENTMEFEIESEAAGVQRAESLALAVIRINEARTLTQAASQYAKDTRPQADETRGQINVDGDSVARILGRPLKTGANVVGQFGRNVRDTFDEFGEFPDPVGNEKAKAATAVVDPVFASHRRSVASQLKLDVYSSNPAVQRFLDAMARARSAGQPRAGVTTVSFARPAEVEVDSGRLRERVLSAVLNEEQDALFETASSILRDAQISADLSARLLKHAILTPTHKSAITEYVAFMRGVGNRGALVEAALDASNEVRALARVRTARMYAYYHQSRTPLSTLISAGHLPLAINKDGALLVALPFDVLSWTPDTQRVFTGLEQFAKRKGISSKVVLLSGVATDKARAGLDAHGFDAVERFLFAR